REVVVNQDPDGGERTCRRHREQGASFDREPALVALVDPCCTRDEERRGRPEHVDGLARLVRVHLEEVDRVRDRRREDTEPEHEPATLESPPREREDTEDGREE